MGSVDVNEQTNRNCDLMVGASISGHDSVEPSSYREKKTSDDFVFFFLQ